MLRKPLFYEVINLPPLLTVKAKILPATQREVRLRERGKEVAIIAVLAGEGGCDQPN